MNCFNKQNKIYIKPTSIRSTVKSYPGSGHIYKCIHQILCWIVKYDLFLYRCHRYKVFVFFKVYYLTLTFTQRLFSILELYTHYLRDKECIEPRNKEGRIQKVSLMVVVVGGSAGWKWRRLQCLPLQMQIDEIGTKSQRLLPPRNLSPETRGFLTGPCANLYIQPKEIHLFLIHHKQSFLLCSFS